MKTIYGPEYSNLKTVRKRLEALLIRESVNHRAQTGFRLFEYLTSRIKNEKSMLAKCEKKNIEPTLENVLYTIKDAVGFRLVTSFIEDIYKIKEFLETLDYIEIVEEKDYVKNSKDNGYRSLHLIVKYSFPTGKFYFVEIQLRTIAQDSWASLEHKMKYKQEIINDEFITKELKRCSDELYSADLSMQTIRNLIQRKGEQ